MLILNDVERKAKQVVARHFKKHHGPLGLETRFREDLGADSLDFIELLYEFEQELGVSIPDAAAADLRTIGDAVRYVQQARS